MNATGTVTWKRASAVVLGDIVVTQWGPTTVTRITPGPGPTVNVHGTALESGTGYVSTMRTDAPVLVLNGAGA